MRAALPNPGCITRTVFLAPLLAAAAAVVLLVVAQSSAGADPIDDASLKPHRTGWYTNVAQQKHLTCAATCQTKAQALAEYEASAVAPTKRAFVCRVPGTPAGWLYGSQFDDRATCYTVGLDFKGSYSERYMCLCVARGSRQ